MCESHVPDAKRLAKLCIDTFDGIPKTGKPMTDNNEWTVLSCILLFNKRTDNLEVVSLGTGKRSEESNSINRQLTNFIFHFSFWSGTKCIGHQSMSANGSILNDSHAEVMCRRGFIRYLYSELQSTKKSNSMFTLNRETKKFDLNSDASFHFFTTHGPCGDASIFQLSSEEIPSKRRKLNESPNATNTENFTGAKIIACGYDVPSDLMIQSIGAVRTKPGRGIHTLSMSCSDKMAKWNVLGVQGALLHAIIGKSIYLESITLLKTAHSNIEALERAIWKRFDSANYQLPCKDMIIAKPIVRECDEIKFLFEKEDDRKPSPSSIVWCKVNDRPLEVVVAGKRQGVTKKTINTPSGRLMISKNAFFKKFIETINLFEHDLESLKGDKSISELTYAEAKMLSTQYQNTFNELKRNYFRIWTTKRNELNQFRCDD